MNPIREYLHKKEKSVEAFAEESGICKRQMFRYVCDRVAPTAKAAVKMEKASNGELSRVMVLWPDYARELISKNRKNVLNCS